MTKPTKGAFIQAGPALVANGYTIVPIPKGSKGPRLPDWRNLRLTNRTEFEAFCTGTHTIEVDGEEKAVPNVREGAGVGILTTWTPAVDLDVLDEDMAAHMERFVRENVDDAPLRIGKAPKRLLLYRTLSPFAKVTSASYRMPGQEATSRIEVLGSGQQFVAYHIHPDTGRPYTWPNDWEEPTEIRAVDLPLITEAHAKAICREFEREAAARGWEKVEAANEGGDEVDVLAREAPPAEETSEIDRVKDALKHIDPDCSRVVYLNILAGLKWTGWACAEEIAYEWASESEFKFDEKDFNRDWKSLKQERNGRTTTLASIYGYAKEKGWDASRPKADTSNAYNALLALIAESDLKDRSVQKSVMNEIAKSELDALDAADLRKVFCKATGMTIRDYERVLKEARRSAKTTETKEATHARYAKALVKEIETETGEDVVSVEGRIWTFDRSERIWVGRTPTEFEVDVARHFDGQENCTRRTDYLAIANHMNSMSAAGREEFFQDAPAGLACGDRFYGIKDGEIEREKLLARHRQRFLSPVIPKVMDTPKWDAFMERTFRGDIDREQEILLEEYIGACLIGAITQFEKALYMYGKSRAGKGTILKIISAMFPRQVMSAVSPTKWDNEYYLASIAGKRINLVGELPDDEAINANAFKGVIGRDELSARQPAGMPFVFRNSAGHIFQGNHFIFTREHSDAFYSRWIMMHFQNSMLRDEEHINTNLAAEIIAEELPGVVAKCLQGAKRLLERKRFATTRQHNFLIAKWRKRSSTVMEFLHDGEVCVMGDFPQVETKRSVFYEAYVEWCRVSGRKPLGKQKFYDEIETDEVSNLGVRFAAKTGRTVLVRGIALTRVLVGFEIPIPDEDW